MGTKPGETTSTVDIDTCQDGDPKPMTTSTLRGGGLWRCPTTEGGGQVEVRSDSTTVSSSIKDVRAAYTSRKCLHSEVAWRNEVPWYQDGMSFKDLIGIRLVGSGPADKSFMGPENIAVAPPSRYHCRGYPGWSSSPHQSSYPSTGIWTVGVPVGLLAAVEAVASTQVH